MSVSLSPAVRTGSPMGTIEFEEIARFAAVMMWRSGPDKEFDWFNQPWIDFVGRPIEQELGHGWAERVHPDDHGRWVEIYAASFDAHEPFSMEYRLLRHDGEYRWLLNNAAPFFREGRFGGYVGSCVDITTQKQHEAGRHVMMLELDHRVKNTLATVQSMAAQSFHGRQARDAYAVFTSRLVALARAHDVLSRRKWQDAPLHEVLGEAVRPHLRLGEALEASGPDVLLSAKAALVLSTMFHELGANAASAGALSIPAGRVLVSWAVSSDVTPALILNWEEHGGPAVSPPVRQGFGIRLTRQLGQELHGDARLDFASSGLVFTLRAPLPNVVASSMSG